jgi:mannan polymerase II complex ANP1 subunit
MEIDGVGGVSILAKAKVFRQGVHFPAFSFEKHAETEGFGKVSDSSKRTFINMLTQEQMAKRMKFSVVGLPHYTIWHLYEPSVDDIRHMEEMEKERKAKEAEETAKKQKEDKIKEQFDNKGSDWEKEKAAVQDLVQKAKNEEKEETKKKEEEKKEEEKKGNEAAKEAAKEGAKEEAKAEKVKEERPQEVAKKETADTKKDVEKREEIHEAWGVDEKVKAAPKQ